MLSSVNVLLSPSLAWKADSCSHALCPLKCGLWLTSYKENMVIWDMSFKMNLQKGSGFHLAFSFTLMEATCLVVSWPNGGLWSIANEELRPSIQQTTRKELHPAVNHLSDSGKPVKAWEDCISGHTLITEERLSTQVSYSQSPGQQKWWDNKCLFQAMF